MPGPVSLAQQTKREDRVKPALTCKRVIATVTKPVYLVSLPASVAVALSPLEALLRFFVDATSLCSHPFPRRSEQVRKIRVSVVERDLRSEKYTK